MRISKNQLLCEIDSMKFFQAMKIMRVEPRHVHLLRQVDGFIDVMMYGPGKVPFAHEVGMNYKENRRFIQAKLELWKPYGRQG